MAFGNLVVFAGQSWLDGAFSGSNADIVPTHDNVYAMAAKSRVFTKFDVAAKWNTFLDVVTIGNSPVLKFAAEWQGRINGGALSEDLFILSVARGGSGFDLQYEIIGSTQWREDRKMNDGLGGSTGLYDIPADIGGGVYEIGNNCSAYETLKQSLTAAVADIEGRGLTARLLFVCWAQGHAEATVASLSSVAYKDYELSIKTLVETTLNISDAPWFTVKIAGGGIARPSAAAVNSAKDEIASEHSNARVVEVVEFPEYDPEDTEFYGGIMGNDGVHLSDFGCWRIADACVSLSIDSGNMGITL